jgi:hypothetical protein
VLIGSTTLTDLERQSLKEKHTKGFRVLEESAKTAEIITYRHGISSTQSNEAEHKEQARNVLR